MNKGNPLALAVRGTEALGRSKPTGELQLIRWNVVVRRRFAEGLQKEWERMFMRASCVNLRVVSGGDFGSVVDREMGERMPNHKYFRILPTYCYGLMVSK